jgi:hypothetical protein
MQRKKEIIPGEKKILCLCTAGLDRSAAVRDYLISNFSKRTKWNTWVAGIREFGSNDSEVSVISRLLEADVIFAADTQHETFARGAIRAYCHALKRPRPDVAIRNLGIRDYEKDSVEIPTNTLDRFMLLLCGEENNGLEKTGLEKTGLEKTGLQGAVDGAGSAKQEAKGKAKPAKKSKKAKK